MFRHPAWLLRVNTVGMLLLWLCTLPQLANARNLQVGLHIQTERLQLAYAQTERQTDIGQITLVWHEILAPWLDGTIRLGKFKLSQNSNPIPAGQATTGTSAGLSLRFYAYRTPRLQLSTDLGYQYIDSSASLSGEAVDMSWYQLTGQLSANIRLLGNSYLSLGAGALDIHGDEHATGTTTSVTSFHSKNNGFARIGLLIGLDPDSHIGLEVDTGSIAGVRITFQRWF